MWGMSSIQRDSVLVLAVVHCPNSPEYVFTHCLFVLGDRDVLDNRH